MLLVTITFPLHATTPGFDTLVNYDTAWTFVYDGGKYKDGTNILDIFHDVKVMPNGVCVCVGKSGDTSSSVPDFFVLYLDTAGKILRKKIIVRNSNGSEAYSVAIAKNGDLIIGGKKSGDPFLVRTDSLLNVKWATWYSDSINLSSLLYTSATLNAVRETSRNTIMCAAGDPYPYPALGGHNYAALIEFDSAGQNPHVSQWQYPPGLNINGFDVEEVPFDSGFILCGNNGLMYTNKNRGPYYQKQYGFQLTGVGSELAEVNRAKILRDGSLFIAGRVYEADCWTRYQKFYYDAWWTPAKLGNGLNTSWDTAGISGQDERVLDFTQLKNGNIVLVGEAPRQDNNLTQMLICIIDSLGKTLWTQKFQFPNSTNTTIPYSVIATSDGGFTIVGAGANGDAIAVHYVLKPVSAVVYRGYSEGKASLGFIIHVSGSRLTVLNNTPIKQKGEVSLFDISGRCLTTKTGNKEIVFDISNISYGTYFVRVPSAKGIQTVKMIMGK